MNKSYFLSDIRTIIQSNSVQSTRTYNFSYRNTNPNMESIIRVKQSHYKHLYWKIQCVSQVAGNVQFRWMKIDSFYFSFGQHFYPSYLLTLTWGSYNFLAKLIVHIKLLLLKHMSGKIAFSITTRWLLRARIDAINIYFSVYTSFQHTPYIKYAGINTPMWMGGGGYETGNKRSIY